MTEPRLNITLSREQVNGLNRLKYGDRKAIFSALVDRVNEALNCNEGNEAMVVAAISEGHVGLKELIKWKE